MRYTLLALLLTGCATQAPADLQAVKERVDRRISYAHYAKRDFRVVPSWEKGSGNCAVFAQTYLTEAMQAGYEGEIVLCRTAKGEGHAYTRVGEWAMDNRLRQVVHVNLEDCR